jgi:hypothetical protein
MRTACVALLLLAACSNEKQSALSDTAAATTRTAIPRNSAAGDTSAGAECPEFGAWRECSVLDRLEDAGLVVKRESDPTELPFFSVKGIRFTSSRASIHVFLYPDQAARVRDTEQLDSAAVAPRGGTYGWPDPAILVTSNNLAAVVVSPNERQTERIVLALGAGLPSR